MLRIDVGFERRDVSVEEIRDLQSKLLRQARLDMLTLHKEEVMLLDAILSWCCKQDTGEVNK